MSRLRRVALGMSLCLAGPCLVAAVATAQVYPTTFQVLDYAPGADQRNARLLGMGNLTMASDLHTRLGLWEFARSPVGVLEADTTSTVELWPNGAAGEVTTVNPDTDLERQTMVASGGRVGYEVWRRVQGSNAFGLYGTLESPTLGRPYNDDIEKRGN